MKPIGRVSGDCSDIGCWVGDLPKGCKLCIEGLKSVFFITGLCRDNCYYCPVSSVRRGVDVAYINEVRLSRLDDFRVVELEIIASGSKGVGITGGDPLLVSERALKYVSRLKEVFGDDFHVHLYTSGTQVRGDVLKALDDVGLDEIRFHIISRSSWRALEEALRYSMDVVIEVPVIPNSIEWLKSLIRRAEELGVKYVNLNELEVSDSNYEALILRGFKLRDDSSAVAGSEETALEVIRYVSESNTSVNVHYCPAIFKDRHQLVRRLMRRGLRTKYVYEELTNGLVRWVRVDSEVCRDLTLYQVLDMVISDGRYYYVPPKLARKINLSSCYGELVEALPTSDRQLVNVFRLNSSEVSYSA